MRAVNDEGATAIVAAICRLRADREMPLLVALDGRSGAGKSTLAASVAEAIDAAIVTSDDFYVEPVGGWAVRSAAEKANGCIDWRRLRTEALAPLLAGRAAAYNPFDFAAAFGLAAQLVRVEPAPVILLDGIYSARPELADLVHLAVLVDVPDETARRQRLLAREGPTFMDGWHALWDAAEDHYFAAVRPRASFDLIVAAG